MDAHVLKPDYSTFDLSHLHRTSIDMGQLVPVSVIPTMPGDHLKVDVEAFVRGMPTIAPIIDKVDIKVNHFYVPYRVLWEKFEDFIAQSDDYKYHGTPKPIIPQVRLSEGTIIGAPIPGFGDVSVPSLAYPNGRLADYLGLPKQGNGAYVSAMPFLAYQRIFYDYYAPQRWVEYLSKTGVAHELMKHKKVLEQVRKGDGGTITTNTLGGDFDKWQAITKLRQVGWNHDYFTNALPTPTLYGDVKLSLFENGTPNNQKHFIKDPQSGDVINFNADMNAGAINASRLSTIRDLRQNIALQHYMERLGTTGGRYMETMKIMWNQDIKNQTLQRSEYLGGDVMPLFVNEVESAAATDNAGLGDLAGKPIGAGRTKNIEFSCDEFGIYMAIAHIVPKRTYCDIMEKNLWAIKDPLDLPHPDFENIGDQAVYQWELKGTGDQVFGYVPRYSEYKGKPDRFSGELRYSLKHWHMGTFNEQLSNITEISPEFINCNPREDIFQVVSEPDKFIASFQMNVKANRKLQSNPLPGMSRI